MDLFFLFIILIIVSGYLLSQEKIKQKWLILLFLAFIFIAIFFNRKKKYREGYIQVDARKLITHSLGLPFLSDRNTFYRVVNTPLRPLRSPYIKIKDIELPRMYLYRPNVLSPVRDQGKCGACWAFVVTSVLSDRIAAQTGGDFNKNLSVQQLLQCYNFPKGCDGENPEDVFHWLGDNDIKLTLSAEYKYRMDKGGQLRGKCPTIEDGIDVDPNSIHSIVKYIDEKKYDKKILQENITNMKKELIMNGPFFASMKVYKDLYTPKGNKIYFPKTSQVEGGHAVEIVGYCDQGVDPRQRFKPGYWVVKNCWGDKWPDLAEIPGYFCILMGKNACGIESRCGYANTGIKIERKEREDIVITDPKVMVLDIKDKLFHL